MPKVMGGFRLCPLRNVQIVRADKAKDPKVSEEELKIPTDRRYLPTLDSSFSKQHSRRHPRRRLLTLHSQRASAPICAAWNRVVLSVDRAFKFFGKNEMPHG